MNAKRARLEQEKTAWTQRLMAVLYIGLCFLSYYSECYRLPVETKYFVNIAITAWMLAAFFVHPRFKKMEFCIKSFVIHFMPFIFFWLWSLTIWTFEFQTTDYIIRGSKNITYMFTNIAFVCSSFYLFEKKSVYYNFCAMGIANTLILLRTISRQGLSAVVTGYITLLKTFANITTPAMLSLEIHGIVFGWGLFLMYFVMTVKDRPKLHIPLVVIALFFFTLSLKRIGVIGAMLAIVFGLLFRKAKDDTKKGLVLTLSFFVTAVAFAYVVSIKTGAFNALSEHFGINLMGRDVITDYYKQFFEISPAYMGRGIRFVYNHGKTVSGMPSLHNVFLEHYIELGFLGWFVWMLYDTYFRLRWIGNDHGYEAVTFLFASNIYAFLSYASDNTYFYFVINVVYRLISIVWCHDWMKKKGIWQEDIEKSDAFSI